MFVNCIMILAEAFSPCHITGFFQIVDESMDPLRVGSRGGGVCLKRGVKTVVRAEKASSPAIQISINGIPSNSAEVSERVVNMFMSRFKELRSFKIFVEHYVDVPIGAGYGTSGAAALSLSLALNEVFNLGMSNVEAAQIAHIAEIECRTGLGTVAAEFSGGVEVRVKAGAPGICEIMHIPASSDYVVVCLTIGALSTKELLANDEVRRHVNAYGHELVNEIVKAPNLSNLMRFSRYFADHIGLVSSRVREVFKAADEIGLTVSMPMFGEGAFTICRRDSAKDVLELFSRCIPQGQVFVSEIDFKGARVIL
jgi:pantoate kinase